jgi:imidazoleglycerol phosphate dehydratase HisB
MSRTATVERATKESKVSVVLDLDGTGSTTVKQVRLHTALS